MDKILLFIPMYNCEKQIIRVLKQLNTEICTYISEIIIINNCSTDNSEQRAEEYLKKVHFNISIKLLRNDTDYGFGGSLKVAFNYAIVNKFDWIMILHGDDQGSISNIVPYLKNRTYVKYDCFLGARFMKGARLQGYSKFRTVGNIAYNILFSIGTGKKIYDLGSGLNMYNVSKLKSGFYNKYSDDMMINCYLILGFIYYQYRIRFFPIVWREDDQISNVKLMNQSILTLKILFEFILDKKRFLKSEHRKIVRRSYTFREIYSNDF